jgi:hypothetical protein
MPSKTNQSCRVGLMWQVDGARDCDALTLWLAVYLTESVVRVCDREAQSKKGEGGHCRAMDARSAVTTAVHPIPSTVTPAAPASKGAGAQPC